MTAVLALGLGAGSFVHEANADWQYTRWGMSVDEVVQASGGTVQAERDAGDDINQAQALAVGSYRADSLQLKTSFLFTPSDGLSAVLLQATNPPDECPTMLDLAKRAYGTPLRQSRPVQDMIHMEWQDDVAGNRIVLNWSIDHYCAVLYSPRSLPNQPGGL